MNEILNWVLAEPTVTCPRVLSRFYGKREIIAGKHFDGNSEFLYFPGSGDISHDGVTFAKKTGHFDIKPRHFAVIVGRLSQLFLMVGCYGGGHVTLPGHLGRWALLEKD